jgi:hypothetical protein
MRSPTAVQLGTLLESDTGHRYQWQHVGGSHAGMGTVMMPHVYQIAGKAHDTVCCLTHGLGTAHKGDYRAIGGFAGVDVE